MKKQISTDRVATTVKVESGLYDEFKVLGIRNKLTLQGLVERCVSLYVKDDTFRETVNNLLVVPQLSTSGSFLL